MRKSLALLASFFLFPTTLVAQTPNPPAPIESQPSSQESHDASPHHDDFPLVTQLLQATPPQRRPLATTLSTDPDFLPQVDAWITQTAIDNPQNLILKDALTALPPASSGPRLTALARKTRDPQLQNAWTRWLRQYPDVYASVLVTWLKQDIDNPSRFFDLLAIFETLRHDDALDLWAQHIASTPVSDLGSHAAFGLTYDGCTHTILRRLTKHTDELPTLRLARALLQCRDATAPLPDDAPQILDRLVSPLATSSAPSRRIVALDLIATFPHALDPTTARDTARHAYDDKNSTVRAHALRALQALGDPDQRPRLLSALADGDETLRLEAASLLASSSAFSQDEISLLKDAFTRELWPDIQLPLYDAIRQHENSPLLARSILKDDLRPHPLRMRALQDLTHSRQLSIDDFNALQLSPNPSLELVASAAESLYEITPDTRPTLRQWLQIQSPLDRRFVSTLARFLKIDEIHRDTAALGMMRSLCAFDPLQETLVKPCLHFMQNHGDDSDLPLLDALNKKQRQIDAIVNFEL